MAVGFGPVCVSAEEVHAGGAGVPCPFFSCWETPFKVKAAPVSSEIRLQGEPTAELPAVWVAGVTVGGRGPAAREGAMRGRGG